MFVRLHTKPVQDLAQNDAPISENKVVNTFLCRFCCRKRGEPPRNKPRPKHPLKIHIWAGISIPSATAVCIFEGRLNAPLFVQILDKTLLTFVEEVFPEGHHFMQDNDPNTVQSVLRSSLRIMESTGGAPLLNLPTSTPLRTFGMS